jgi:LPXTG-motif cell wall-anchored protein
MDWKLLLIGGLMTVAGGFLMFRFRRTNYSREAGPGCIMSFAILLAMTGLLAILFSFIVRV